MARHSITAAAAFALLLAGCTPLSTPYQPLSASNRISGGYSEIRLADDRYRVTFAGNDFTSRDTVEGCLLYRAAELTVAQGYDWFSVVDRETEHRVERRVEPDPLYDPWYGPAYRNWSPEWHYYSPAYGWRAWYPYRNDPFWTSRIDVRTIERFEATAEILMRHGDAPSDDPKALKARDVMETLGPRIVRPEPACPCEE